MFENLYKLSNDSLVAKGNTLQSDKDRIKLNELMELCTNLQTKVIYLEKIKTTQANEIDSLKRMVKKLERRNKSRTHKLKRLYKVRLTAKVESSEDKECLDKDLGGDKVFVEQEVVADKEKINEVTLDCDQAKIDVVHQLAERLEAEEQQELTDEEKAIVNTFEDFRTKLVQGQEKEKRAEEEVIQKRTKKSKMEDDKETVKLQQLMEIILDKEEVEIDAILLAAKSLRIVD
uniref:Uncharacterized protein n=1 Tax=Tanacetum cinerariifolium TaxID=118510 RepID=A0A699GPC7_TANCI|nr:hypothetical protein [Tanacetum cinerariifolium]